MRRPSVLIVARRIHWEAGSAFAKPYTRCLTERMELRKRFTVIRETQIFLRLHQDVSRRYLFSRRLPLLDFSSSCHGLSQACCRILRPGQEASSNVHRHAYTERFSSDKRRGLRESRVGMQRQGLIGVLTWVFRYILLELRRASASITMLDPIAPDPDEKTALQLILVRTIGLSASRVFIDGRVCRSAGLFHSSRWPSIYWTTIILKLWQ